MSNETGNRPVALVTGGNKGIGFEVARQLGRDHGMAVVLGCRDGGRGRAAAERLAAEGIDARAVVLDVTDPASVAAAAGTLGRLDVLVNNAGIVAAGDRRPATDVELADLRATFETNVFGPATVTRLMLPLLRRSPAGRVVNVSSGLGSLAQNSDPTWQYAAVKALAYNSSKAALNMQTVILAAALAGTAVKVNAADPGYTATDLNGNQGTQSVEQGSRAIVRLATLGPDGPTGGYFDAAGVVPW